MHIILSQQSRAGPRGSPPARIRPTTRPQIRPARRPGGRCPPAPTRRPQEAHPTPTGWSCHRSCKAKLYLPHLPSSRKGLLQVSYGGPDLSGHDHRTRTQPAKENITWINQSKQFLVHVSEAPLISLLLGADTVGLLVDPGSAVPRIVASDVCGFNHTHTCDAKTAKAKTRSTAWCNQAWYIVTVHGVNRKYRVPETVHRD